MWTELYASAWTGAVAQTYQANRRRDALFDGYGGATIRRALAEKLDGDFDGFYKLNEMEVIASLAQVGVKTREKRKITSMAGQTLKFKEEIVLIGPPIGIGMYSCARCMCDGVV